MKKGLDQAVAPSRQPQLAGQVSAKDNRAADGRRFGYRASGLANCPPNRVRT